MKYRIRWFTKHGITSIVQRVDTLDEVDAMHLDKVLLLLAARDEGGNSAIDGIGKCRTSQVDDDPDPVVVYFYLRENEHVDD